MNKPTPPLSAQARLETFDFLRGLAIMGVIVYHTVDKIPSKIGLIDHLAGLGMFGVQLFYFVSAITMCYMWKTRLGEPNPVRNFYIRRFFRIAPLFWLAIPIYLLINGFEASYWAPEGIGALQIMLTATFLHGFWFDSINSVVPGSWSIAVEMTFYALFPFLVLKIKDKKGVYLVLASVVWGFNTFVFRGWVAGFFATHYDTSSTTLIEEYLYMNFLNQAPIFLLGCYLYFALQNKPGKLEVLYLGAWFLLGLGLKFFHKIDGFGFLAVCMALGVFVYGCMRLGARFKPLEMLGQSSYAIYLGHFMVLHYWRGLSPWPTGLPAFLLAVAVITLASYGLALLVHALVEKKVQRFVEAITRPGGLRQVA
jgi:exopolysaccharide production protein ExoZ